MIDITKTVLNFRHDINKDRMIIYKSERNNNVILKQFEDSINDQLILCECGHSKIDHVIRENQRLDKKQNDSCWGRKDGINNICNCQKFKERIKSHFLLWRKTKTNPH